jgi:probable rRNA maturation factor
VNSFDLLFENIPQPQWIDNIHLYIDKLLNILDIENWEFSITFCDNEFIQQLNREYRSINSATDVLTFAQDDEALPFENNETVHNVGDIIISLHTLGENAEYFGVEEEEELKRLLIHGILHLSGMDHSDNSPEQEMLIYQEKILTRLSGVKIF